VDRSTDDTDKVIVVGAFKIDLEARGPLRACDLADESALFEHPKSTEHGGSADPFTFEFLIDLIEADMTVGL